MEEETATNSRTVEAQLEHLLATIQKNNPQADTDLVRLAFDFAERAHRGQTRKSGEPYIVHPLAAAQRLADMNMEQNILIAALLHDVPEDSEIMSVDEALREIDKHFGHDVASMVEGITKLGKLKYRGVERYIENLRKMFVAFAEDARVILIKFADRIHNLQTLDALPPKKQYRIALESLEIFAPIANRLGIHEMKGLLEDYAFKYVYPKEYKRIKSMAQEKVSIREEYYAVLAQKTRKALTEAGVEPIIIEWRGKHLYSLYRKMLRKDNDIDKIYDLVAMRIVVREMPDCYAVLGILHKLWRPLKGRVKDYIAQPKPNGYQSLHTTVFCDNGQIVEFQIRTEAMNQEAEYGIAAHWHYDERGSKIPDRHLRWIKELAKVQQEIMKRVKDIEYMKIDYFKNRIFVFTPKGDVMDLPEEATPVDFAYAIHTHVGNTCVGATVNDKMSSLDTPLRNGDVVDIMTDKNRKGPSADWLKFVKTTHARSQIRSHTKNTIKDWLTSVINR